MQALMQEWPLTCNRIIDHAATQFGDHKVITRSVEGPIVETTYRDIRKRALKVAQRLAKEGIKPGDRVGTLAWNTARHLESWYGILGAGAVYHTVNPRLFPEQIIYIINHAEDRLMLVDLTFVPMLEAIAEKLPAIERYIVLTDRAHMPQTKLKNAVAYEDWIAEADGDFSWMKVDENSAAGMCYTSGTTGNPKGVVYSHRSNMLQAFATAVPDVFSISSNSIILPVVPLFHANSWSLAFSAPMNGATLVMPGAKLDGPSIYELLDRYKVTATAGVPTVWLALLEHMEKHGLKLPHLKLAFIGGSACPRSMIEKFQDEYDVLVRHAWGMTEMSPVGTAGHLKPHVEACEREQRLDAQEKQGFSLFGVEMKITDDDNNELPWDGKTFGRLKVKGGTVARAYFKGEGGEILDKDGFFDTGDVATIDEHGYMKITDRAKDVIKSGGEWISSIEIENVAVGHPDVAEAAVIGVSHPKWDERPLLIVVPKKDKKIGKADMLDFLRGKIVKWWMPDDVIFVNEIPHTATGKILKMALREQFRDYRLPSAAE